MTGAGATALHTRTTQISLPLAVSLSAAGMAFHTIREFTFAGLLSPASGFLPVAAVQFALLALHVLAPPARKPAAIVLFATAILQLIGGAITSILPLPFLPFAPDQSLHHYLSHFIFGLAQLPLLFAARRTATSP